MVSKFFSILKACRKSLLSLRFCNGNSLCSFDHFLYGLFLSVGINLVTISWTLFKAIFVFLDHIETRAVPHTPDVFLLTGYRESVS